jgi:formylmethanofuran dehydrogenase subunit C
MANKFGKYRPEEEKAVRKVEVVEDETLKTLIAAWKAYPFAPVAGKTYEHALETVKPLEYSASDVESFSIMLAEFQNEKDFTIRAGLFLSALINQGKDRDYVIRTAHLEVPLDYICYQNTKNITVKGDAGDWCGGDMKGGSITVNGNAGARVGGYMKDGAITVKGNSGAIAGERMEGGSITVNGDTEYGAGSEMWGGTVTIEGNTGPSVGYNMIGCRIDVKGDAQTWVGRQMHGGRITVAGNPGGRVGPHMNGGEIRIEGKWRGVSALFVSGRIYRKGKLVVDE